MNIRIRKKNNFDVDIPFDNSINTNQNFKKIT